MDVVTLALAKKYADSVSGGLTIEEVNSLPDVGKDGTLYVVEETIEDEQGTSSTINKLYIYSDGKFIPLDGSDVETISPSFDVESINITYDELVALRDNSQLVPNTQYRIIDYATIISSKGSKNGSVKTESAGHAFDVIVIATSNNELSENALAALHEGDEYFTQDELSKWQLKYSLDNDTSKYAWAYNTNAYAYEEFEAQLGYVDDVYINIKVKYTGTKEYNGVEYHCWGTPEQIKALSLHYEDNENAFVDIVGVEGEDAYGGVAVNLYGLYSNNEITNNYISGAFDKTSPKMLISKGETGKGVIYYMKDDKNNACPYDFKNILYVTGSDTPGFIYHQWGYSYNFTRDTSLDVEGYYGWRCNSTPQSWSNDYCYTTVEAPSTDMILYSDTDGAELSFGGIIESVELGTGFVKLYTFSYETPYEAASVIRIIVKFNGGEENVLFNRKSSLDSNGYYGWESTYYSWHHQIYTTTETPLSNTILYSNTEGKEINSSEYEFLWSNGGFQIFDMSMINLGECYDNSMEECVDNYVLNTLNFNIFKCVEGDTPGIRGNRLSNNCHNNTFETGCSHNTFGYNCRYNIFGSDCYSNTLGDNCSNNTFGDGCQSNAFEHACDSNTFGDGCYDNTFGHGCSYNTFGEKCEHNTFGNHCSNNTLDEVCYRNTLGNDCDDTIFGNNCYDNTLGDDCDRNIFGSKCYSNTLGDNCENNTFGDSCYHSTFGNLCYNNTFEEGCRDNTFGNGCVNNFFRYECAFNTIRDGCSFNIFWDNCDYNTFGDGCEGNTFGSDCYSNTFGDSCIYNTIGDENGTIDFCRYIQLGSKCEYLYINSLDTSASSSNWLQNVIISSNTKGTNADNRLTITIPDRNLEGYEVGMSTYNLQGQQLTLPTYPTDTENKNYILQLSNGTLSWTLLDDGDTGEY